MGDAYWRYNEARQPALPPLPQKRPRPEYDIPGGHELPGYFSREDERAGYRMTGETDTLGASYDRYLRSGIAAYGGAGEPARPTGTGMLGHPGDEIRVSGVRGFDAMAGKSQNIGMLGHPGDDIRVSGVRGFDPMAGKSQNIGMLGHPGDEIRVSGVRGFDPMAGKSQNIGIAGGKPEISLPQDASNTLFVEGLPANCTRREVSHIFRPFVGFKEVRLVSKESRHSGGDPLVLCFVDFGSPAQAATAMDALQGYKFDEHDRDSENLRLQFARYPGPRSGGGKPRGRR